VTLVFVEDLERPALADGDRHHLERVLRVREGEQLTVSDGVGGHRPVRFGAGAGGVLDPLGSVEHDAPPAPAITVCFAVPKGERPELVVQKLTELGVDRIVPFTSARSVVRWDSERAARHVDRLRRVAREAAMQCHRTWLPSIDALRTFDEVVTLPGAALANGGGGPPTLLHPVLLIGPEGGFTPEELGIGLPAVGLGVHVLRAETAAIAAATALGLLRAGLVHSAVPVLAPTEGR
jgi:16S rRNA (uracil1498-N3)-methyltransferase